MGKHTIDTELIERFKTMLRENEKSPATIQKYVREIQRFGGFLRDQEITKENLVTYREHLQTEYRSQTINGKLAAVNSFLDFIGMSMQHLKYQRVQRQAFAEEERELTQGEYERLLNAAKKRGNERLYYLMLTVAGTGIRISELKFITTEAAARGQAEISLKGKNRIVLLPRELCVRLLRYAGKQGIHTGCIFCTRNGKPVDRSNVCHDMKKLCSDAGVAPGKVFPHNFRHLFARAFYRIEKDLARQADILGHSSIETTRIYTKESARTYERILNRMRLVQT